MSIVPIIEAVADIETLPVEIEHVRRIIIEQGCQDDIIVQGGRNVHPDPEAEPILRGLLYRYTEGNGPDQPATRVCQVIYDCTLSLPWQRLVCCKELVHICDPALEHVQTPDDVIGWELYT